MHSLSPTLVRARSYQMYSRYIWLSISLFIVQCLAQKIVWEDPIDLCYYDYAIVLPSSRKFSRCENSNYIRVEKRMFRNFYYWCIAIDLTSEEYKTLEIEFNEPKNLHGQAATAEHFLQISENIPYAANYSSDPQIEITNKYKVTYRLTKEAIKHTFLAKLFKTFIKLPGLNSEVNRIVSLKLNGRETCNPIFANDIDPIYPNQRNYNSLRYYKNCVVLNAHRAEPEPNPCERLPEVNIRKLVLNNDIAFWCVTVDKLFVPGKFNHLPLILTIEPTFSKLVHVTFLDTNNFVNSDDRILTFNVPDRIILSIEPKESEVDVGDILSLKVNGIESCGFKSTIFQCGEQKIKHRPFIAFGLPTYAGQYPWHIALYELTRKGIRNYICGGSIVARNFILTVAHCVESQNRITPAALLRVEVGKHDLTKSTKYSKEHQVVRVIPHENFDRTYLENDIAILKLAKFIEYNNYVQPICFSSNIRAFDEVAGVVPGWGRDEYNEIREVLADAPVIISEYFECRRSNRNFFHRYLNEGKFCAGYRNGTAVCAGDSGGGLVVQFPTRWYLRGLVSLGVSDRGVCALDQFVLFTDVTQYYNWISTKLLL